MATPFRRLNLAALLVLASCGGDGGTGPSTDDGDNPYGLTLTGPGVLSVSPLDTSTVISVTPLGKIGPPGHTLPTDHIYISFVDPYGGNQQNNDCSKRPVYAAGAGVVYFTYVTEARGDTKVDIQMTKTFHYYYDHVLLLPGIAPGTHVTAGQQIATTTGFCPSIDLGVWDLDVTLPGLVNPARYGDQTRHAVSPIKYFAEPLRTLYYSRVRLPEGVPANRDGRIDYGIAGRLIGDWFHASVPMNPQASGGPEGWVKSLAFAPDWSNGKMQFSLGGTLGPAFYGYIASGDPDPASVSTSSGEVAYQVTRPGATEPYAWVLVQLLSTERLKVQLFLGATTRPAGFTTAAQEYLR